MLAAHLSAVLTKRELEDLRAVVSELVANAYVHGEGAIRLRVEVEPDHVRGEVADEGSGFEADVRERGIREIGGRGLFIVAALACRWGVYDDSSHVWFVLAREPTGAGPTPPELGRDRGGGT